MNVTWDIAVRYLRTGRLKQGELTAEGAVT